MTLSTTPDMLGEEIKAGDTIAVAFREGNTASLRIGTVVGFGTKQSYKPIDVMEVEWHSSSPGGWMPSGKKSKIEVAHKRFVKMA